MKIKTLLFACLVTLITLPCYAHDQGRDRNQSAQDREDRNLWQENRDDLRRQRRFPGYHKEETGDYDEQPRRYRPLRQQGNIAEANEQVFEEPSL